MSDATRRWIAQTGTMDIMALPLLQPDLILTLDYSGVIQHAQLSNQDREILGDDQLDQWLGQPWRDTCEASNHAKVERLIQGAINHDITGYSQINQNFPSGASALYEFVAVRGEPQHIKVAGKNLRAVVKMQKRLLASQRDIETEIWKLRELEARYTALANANSDAVLIVSDPDLQVIDANAQAKRSIGLNVGDSISELVLSERDTRKIQQLLETAKQSGRAPLSILVAGIDRESWRVRVSSYPSNGAVHYMLQFSLHNLLNRISSVETAGEITFSDIVTHLPDGMVAVDAHNIITHVNPAFAALANRESIEDMLGQPIDRWLRTADLSLGALRQRLDQEERVNDFPGHIHTTQDKSPSPRKNVLLSAKRLPGDNSGLMLMTVRPVAA